MRRIVIAGASRGIGAALAAYYVDLGDDVISLSRRASPYGRWLPCDLSDPVQIAGLQGRIGTPIDALVFVAGIWEETAFTRDYDFASRPVTETAAILSVNLLSPILLAQALLGFFSQGKPGRIILIGSTSGLDNIGTPEVAYNASKAGLRSAAQALQRACPKLAITTINPGDVATDATVAAKSAGTMTQDGAIAMADMVASVDFALSLSPASVAREITLDPMLP